MPSNPSPGLKRFFLETPLSQGQRVTLPEDLQHRLSRVLRLAEGAAIALWNGEDGLFAATIADAKCRAAAVSGQLLPQPRKQPLTLALSLPKREAWETALRQATELGVTHIIPLKTEFSQVAKLNPERVHTILQEAAEQAETLILPSIAEVQSLPQFLHALKGPCAWAYERHDGDSSTPKADTLLVGPEGGFSPSEVQLLLANANIKAFSLGATILRVDTAVVAALSRLTA